MTRAGPLAAVVLALCTSCFYTISDPMRGDHPTSARVTAASIRFEQLAGRLHPLLDPATLRPEEILAERLGARGVGPSARAGPSGADPVVTGALLGKEATALTRWTAFPLAAAHLVTLGLVPHREAHEYVVEVQVFDPGAPAGRRFRAARSSFVVAFWSWLPLLPWTSAGRDAVLAVHREGLTRALDDALDEVLEPATP